MKLIKSILFLTFFYFSSITIYGQKVTSVDASFSGDIMIINYTLTGAKFNQKFDVELYVSFDGGKTFEGPMKEVTGHVGENIKAGNKRIYWSPYKEVNFLGGELVFDVRAKVIEEDIKKQFFVHYTGHYSLRNKNYTSPFGISIGQIGKVGWYFSARLNSSAFDNSQYDYNGNTVIGYDKVLYFEYDEDYKYPSFEALGGITIQLGWNSFWYMGVGYGYQKYYWHINEYDYMDNSLQSDSYLDYTDYSANGLSLEGGFIFKVNKVSFNLGYSTLNFGYSNIVFGIGLNF